MSTAVVVRAFDYESRPVRVVFGAGRLAEVAAETDRLGARRVMVISDGHAPNQDVLMAVLGERVALRWQEVAQHVPVGLADRAVQAARDAEVDAVVSLGGGSSTGLAKAVALSTGIPIVAVPTTYAGSELTAVYGMTGENRKRTGTHERVRPKVVVYDPELTVGLPAGVTGPSAFNSLAHCFSALWSPQGDPLTSALAADAVRTVQVSLPAALARPDDLDARAGLQYAAFLAGTALASAGTGLQHKISHELGGRLSLSHADTHSVVLPYVVALNTPAAPDMVARLRPFLGDTPGLALWQLAKDSGLSTDLASLGARREHLREVAEAVAHTANPVPVDAAMVEALLELALDGASPVR